jgi:hypothetical protein
MVYFLRMRFLRGHLSRFVENKAKLGDYRVFRFAIIPRPCFGWSHPEGPDNKGERFFAVLEIPPVDSPETAVKIAIAAEVKGKK